MCILTRSQKGPRSIRFHQIVVRGCRGKVKNNMSQHMKGQGAIFIDQTVRETQNVIQSVDYLIPVKFARILFSVEAQKSNISRKARYIFFCVFYSLGQSEFRAAIFVFRSARQEKKNKTKMCNRASTFCSTCFLSRTTHYHKNSVQKTRVTRYWL